MRKNDTSGILLLVLIICILPMYLLWMVTKSLIKAGAKTTKYSNHKRTQKEAFDMSLDEIIEIEEFDN